jgi:GntR family transcriptional regulator
MSTKPKHRRIADSLAEDILAGRLKAGDQIPSERVIAEEYGISRMTVRQALRHLAAAGWSRRGWGRGPSSARPGSSSSCRP